MTLSTDEIARTISFGVKFCAIRALANFLTDNHERLVQDTTTLDATLSQIENVVHDLRQEIDDEWRALRMESRKHFPNAFDPKSTEDFA